jgi:hypothetical protein
MVRLALRDELGLALTRAQAFLNRKSWVVISVVRSTTRTGSGCTPCSRSRGSLLRQKPIRCYPIRKVTTPVPVEAGVDGGALPKSAGSSFHGRRNPNGYRQDLDLIEPALCLRFPDARLQPQALKFRVVAGSEQIVLLNAHCDIPRAG